MQPFSRACGSRAGQRQAHRPASTRSPAPEPPRPGRARSKAAEHGSFPLPGCASLSFFRNANTGEESSPAGLAASTAGDSLPAPGPASLAGGRRPAPLPRRRPQPTAAASTTPALPGRRGKRQGCHGRPGSALAPRRGAVGGKGGSSSPGGGAGSESPLPRGAGRPLPTHRRCRLHIRRAGRG